MDASLVGDGSLTNTKVGYLSSISSNLQTQLNGKQATITDGSLTIARTTGLQTALDTKAPNANPSFSGTVIESSIAELVSYNNAYTFSANVLTFSYNTNNSIVYFNSLTANTNFQFAITNMNAGSRTYTNYAISLIIDCTTYKAYADTCTINGTARTLIAGGGTGNISIANASIISNSILQSFNIIYTSSTTVPYKVFTNVIPYY